MRPRLCRRLQHLFNQGLAPGCFHQLEMCIPDLPLHSLGHRFRHRRSESFLECFGMFVSQGVIVSGELSKGLGTPKRSFEALSPNLDILAVAIPEMGITEHTEAFTAYRAENIVTHTLFMDVAIPYSTRSQHSEHRWPTLPPRLFTVSNGLQAPRQT